MVAQERSSWLMALAVFVSLAIHAAWLTLHDQQELTPVLAGGDAVPVTVSFASAPRPTANASKSSASLVEHPSKEVVKESMLSASVETVQPNQVLPNQVPHETDDSKKAEDTAPEPAAAEESAVLSSQERLPQVASVESVQPLDDNSLPIVTEPSFTAKPRPPAYPKIALKRRWQGEALIRALINNSGKTERVELVRSSGFELLDQSALKAVAGWSFAAAKLDGQSTRAWVQVPVDFTIR